jgi:hypothetical protein
MTGNLKQLIIYKGHESTKNADLNRLRTALHLVPWYEDFFKTLSGKLYLKKEIFTQ